MLNLSLTGLWVFSLPIWCSTFLFLLDVWLNLTLVLQQLVGSISSSLTQIDGLSVLDLSHNNLSGKLSTDTQLQSFNASCYENNLDLYGPPLEKLCIDGNRHRNQLLNFLELKNCFSPMNFTRVWQLDLL